MSKKEYVIGVDFGTASVRALLCEAHTWEEISSAEVAYPRWAKGLYCDPIKNQFRQHPLDYIESLEQVIKKLLDPVDPMIKEAIRALSMDTTGSTPGPVDQKGIPLALYPEFKDNPDALFYLWKDHSAIEEAQRINHHAEKIKPDYLKYVGGIYSSEWFWAKLLHAIHADPKVRKACYTWVEHSDWMPFLLTGGQDAAQIKRNVCAAGHKGLWADEFGGYPPAEFFEGLDPELKKHRYRLPDQAYTADKAAGYLSEEWARKLGLSTSVLVGVGALDAHFGAVGSNIMPGYMCKVMGTSTCDMMVAPVVQMEGKLVRGISGQVEGSIIPGMIGMEAGQSAFGDIYDWFRKLLLWPMEHLYRETMDTEQANQTIAALKSRLLHWLSEEADSIEPTQDLELAIDWLNGRRTPDANHQLKGALSGLSLGSDAPRIFRSLVEATCFGSKKIVERFEREGVPVKGIVAVGGVAKKSPFVMQMMADILNIPISVHKSQQTPALGACLFAATVAGIYPSVGDAMAVMGQDFERDYQPDPTRTRLYAARYEQYNKLTQYLELRPEAETFEIR